MSENALLIAFISFVGLLLVIAVIVRKMSVRDIIDNLPSSLSTRPSALSKLAEPQIEQKAFSGVAQEKKQTFNLDRKVINAIGKALGIIGVIMLFAPLPESFNNFSLGMAFLGYLLAKATAPPKEKKNSSSQNPAAQRIRQLAEEPEYQEALKLLYNDYNDSTLLTEEEKYQRATRYLQTKGVPPAEAKENLQLLLRLLTRQKK